MAIKMYLVILALLHAGIAVNAFQITDYRPRTNANSGVKLDEGDDIDLWCKVPSITHGSRGGHKSRSNDSKN